MPLSMKWNENRLTTLTIRVSPAMKERLLDRARIRATFGQRGVTISAVARDLLEFALELTKLPDALGDADVGRHHASGIEQAIARRIDEAHRDGPVVGLHEPQQRAFAATPEAPGLGRSAATGGSQQGLGLLTAVVGLVFAELLRREQMDQPLGAFDLDFADQPHDRCAEARFPGSGRSPDSERAAPLDRANTDVNGPDWLHTAPWIGE